MASSTPNQDLVFFRDNSLIHDKALESKSSYLSIISHVQGTSPNWLVNSLIENAITGTASLINNDLKKVSNRSKVVLISFLHSQDYYIKNCRKNGLDLSNDSNFKFIDCFSDLFIEQIKTPENAIKEVNGLFDKISKSIIDPKTIVFIEAPEILLYCTDITSNDLLFNLIKLNKLCRQLFVISSKDYPQYVDFDSRNPKDATYKITDFLIKLFHRSQLNISLQPLATGRAKDITGSLVVSQGSIPFDIPQIHINEKEYIYNITKDSNVKLYFR
ncbi:uncharacterized protein J8A68_001220 [[Candida] subhashii]|uniref:Elongator complex protein 6 n=1 Tax=[Candida] subhashii TaxID=561895 RepID=A0A8J5V4K2_9ASCO|nr:uncharacterized protein J8A68_001220 [[Candida] subhashii]KAG7665164.1 hypothetical protein J8A68_001220 [[Candida] subhashii]